jgi:hypothetical protein
MDLLRPCEDAPGCGSESGVLLEGSRGALVFGGFRDWHSTFDLTWLCPGTLVVGSAVISRACVGVRHPAFALAVGQKALAVTNVVLWACHGVVVLLC